MAVFPDRIVLKNTTTSSDAIIISEIETGGTYEIVPGELVVKRASGSAKIFTKDASGAIVPVGGAGPINNLTDVDTATVAPTVGDGLKWDGTNWVPGSDINTATPATLGQVLGWDGSGWIPFNSFGTWINTYQETTSNLTSHPLHGPDAFYADQAALEADGFTFIASNVVVASTIPTFNPGPDWDGIDFLGNGITSGGSWYINCQAGVGWDNSFNKTNANYGVQFYTVNIDFHVALWATASSLRLAGYKEITAEGKDWLCVRMDYAIPSGNASAGMPTEVWFAKDGSVSIRYGNAINGGNFSAGSNPGDESAIASNGVILTSDPYTNISYSGDYVLNILQKVPRNDFLGNLGDVTLTTLANGDGIEWNGTEWVNVPGSGGAAVLDDLTDVTITAAAAGEVLRYDGAAWVDAQLDYADLANTPANVSAFANDSGYLTDVVLDVTPQLGGNLDVNGNYIISTANGNVSIAPNGTGLLEVRGNTNDGSIKLNCSANTHGVTIKSPPHAAAATYTLTLPTSAGANGEVLSTDGTGTLSWVANAGGGGASALNDLTDVTITAAATGEVLRYNGSAWVDAQLAYSDLSGTPAIPADIGDLGDVTITSAAAGEVLRYNGSAWVDAQLDYSDLTGTPALVSAIDDLSDVTITAAAAGEVLRYNGSAWVDAQLAYTDLSGTPTNVSSFTNDAGYLVDITAEPIGDLSNVSLTSVTTGDVLSYNGSSWVNSAAPPADISGSSINALNDVDTATSSPSNGEGLIWNSTSGNWEPGTVSAGPVALDDLTDVTITAAATGEVLRYNGSAWVDAQLAYSDLSGTPSLAPVATSGSYNDLTDKPTIPVNIDDLGDVTITSATTGQILEYNGSAWVNVANSGGGGATAIDDLTDVDTTTLGPVNNQVLAWNGANWVPTNSFGTGGSGITYPATYDTTANFPLCGQDSWYANQTAIEADGFTWIGGGDDVALTFSVPVSFQGVDFLGNGISSPATWFVNTNGGVGWDLGGSTTAQRTGNALNDATTIDFYISWFQTDSYALNTGWKEHTAEGKNWLVVRVDMRIPYNSGTQGFPVEAWFATDGSISVRYGSPVGGQSLPTAVNQNVVVSNGVAISDNPFPSLASTGAYAYNMLYNGAQSNARLALLDDATITSPVAGQVLTWNGNEWVNAVASGGGGPVAIDDLTDVDTATNPPATGQVLKWDGANWVPGTDISGGGGSATLGRGDGGDFDTGTVDSAFVFGVYGGGDLDTTSVDAPVELVGGADGGDIT